MLAATPQERGARVVIFTYFIFLPLVLDGREWTARSDESPAVRPRADIFGNGFVEARGVAEGEDHGTVDVAGHLLDDFLGEGAGAGGGSDQDVGFDGLDDAEQVAGAFPVGVVARVALLRGREVGVGSEEEAGLVDAPAIFGSASGSVAWWL